MSGPSSPIDTYLAQLEQRLDTDEQSREQILAELRSHLEEAAAREEARGADRADAEARAVAAFGGAGEIASGLNAVHPARWDALRFARGVAWGVVASWFLWTLITYPLVVYLTLQQGHLVGNPPGVAADPALELLFYATPMAFGAFWVLATDPLLWLVPFLLLYAAIPFAWGLRSRRGWRPGLAYGLGVVVGFPWMLPAVVTHWSLGGPSWGTQVLVTVLAIWLLVPFAMLASWLGSHVRLARRPASAAIRRPASQSNPSLRLALSRSLPTILPRALAIAGALALIALGVWSWTAAEAWGARPQPTLVERLATAQSRLAFPIRLPATLPDGVHLTGVEPPPADCSPCSVSLVFQGAHGEELNLAETDFIAAGVPTHSPPNYGVSQGGVTGYHAVWWLGETVTTEQQVNLDWTAGGIAYFLGSNGAFSADELKQVAASIPTGPAGA
jgi:hypothetical protein